jgi:hypothetical protein
MERSLKQFRRGSDWSSTEWLRWRLGGEINSFYTPQGLRGVQYVIPIDGVRRPPASCALPYSVTSLGVLKLGQWSRRGVDVWKLWR